MRRTPAVMPGVIARGSEMGSTFRYIADGSLTPCGGSQCHHCECSGVPIYSYGGYIVDPTLAKNPQLAREEPDVYELCAECIVGGNVRKHESSMREIVRTIQAFATDRQRATEEYHGTPDLPLFQGKVWPMCCGDFAEYVGEYPPPGTGFGSYQPWQPMNDLVARFRLEDFYPLDKLAVMHTMALFHCPRCPRKYWVFQYSGLFWPGPLADQQQS